MQQGIREVNLCGDSGNIVTRWRNRRSVAVVVWMVMWMVVSVVVLVMMMKLILEMRSVGRFH
jgi:hypothetical protein